jgi:hypothetical protein
MRADGIVRLQTAGTPERRVGAWVRLWGGGKQAALAVGLFAAVFLFAAVPVLLLAAVVALLIAAARARPVRRNGVRGEAPGERGMVVSGERAVLR